MMAGVACAALTVFCVPVAAATDPQSPSAATPGSAAGQAVSAFYASRGGAPLWLKTGQVAAARELIGALRRAPLEGFASGPAPAAQAEALMARAQPGDAAALKTADRLLSSAWVQYVGALQTPPA